jgi:GTP-binding protein HflX
MVNLAERQPPERRPVLVSAATGEGFDALMAAIEARVASKRVVFDLILDAGDGAGISWLHRNAEVLGKRNRDDGKVIMNVRVDPAKAEFVRAKFSS